MVTYCTTDDVALFAQLRAYDGGKIVWGTTPPVPDSSDMESLIESAEKLVEDITKQAYSTRYITIPSEMQDIHLSSTHSNYGTNYAYVFLENQNVADFSSVAGDKLEIFENGAWTDYLTTYTEGRDQDFFVDYKTGKIYFLKSPPIGRLLARITYRCNSGSTVPEAIRQATALQVAILLANSPGIQILFPSGEGGSPTQNLIQNYENLIKKMLAPYTVIKQPMNTKFIAIY